MVNPRPVILRQNQENWIDEEAICILSQMSRAPQPPNFRLESLSGIIKTSKDLLSSRHLEMEFKKREGELSTVPIEIDEKISDRDAKFRYEKLRHG